MLFPVVAAGPVGNEMFGGALGYGCGKRGGSRNLGERWVAGIVRTRKSGDVAPDWHLPMFPQSQSSTCQLLVFCRGMIVHDDPFPVDPLEDKREIPAKITGGPLQMPISDYEGRIAAERLALEPIKRKPSHLGERWIPRLVSIARRLPAAARLAAGTKRQIIGLPIVGHE